MSKRSVQVDIPPEFVSAKISTDRRCESGPEVAHALGRGAGDKTLVLKRPVCHLSPSPARPEP
jgi:hypothetical protein